MGEPEQPPRSISDTDEITARTTVPPQLVALAKGEMDAAAMEKQDLLEPASGTSSTLDDGSADVAAAQPSESKPAIPDQPDSLHPAALSGANPTLSGIGNLRGLGGSSFGIAPLGAAPMGIAPLGLPGAPPLTSSPLSPLPPAPPAEAAAALQVPEAAEVPVAEAQQAEAQAVQAAEAPVAEAQPSEAPAVEAPQPEALVAEALAVEAPQPEALVAEALAVEAPQPEAPVVQDIEAPAVEAQQPEALVAEAPAVQVAEIVSVQADAEAMQGPSDASSNADRVQDAPSSHDESVTKVLPRPIPSSRVQDEPPPDSGWGSFRPPSIAAIASPEEPESVPAQSTAPRGELVSGVEPLSTSTAAVEGAAPTTDPEVAVQSPVSFAQPGVDEPPESTSSNDRDGNWAAAPPSELLDEAAENSGRDVTAIYNPLDVLASEKMLRDAKVSDRAPLDAEPRAVTEDSPPKSVETSASLEAPHADEVRAIPDPPAPIRSTLRSKPPLRPTGPTAERAPILPLVVPVPTSPAGSPDPSGPLSTPQPSASLPTRRLPFLSALPLSALPVAWGVSIAAGIALGWFIGSASTNRKLAAASASASAAVQLARASAIAETQAQAPKLPDYLDLSRPNGIRPIVEIIKSDPSNRTRVEALALGRQWQEKRFDEYNQFANELRRTPQKLEESKTRNRTLDFIHDRLTSRATLELLSELASPRALDLLYEVWTGSKDRNETTQLSEALLLAQDVRKHASGALELALSLREKPTACDDIQKLVERAIREGDRRSAYQLVATASRQNCGPNGSDDCVKCLGDVKDMRRAIRASAARPDPVP